MILPRRKFLAGLIGLVAAPAVVRASSLMPVRTIAAAPNYIMYPAHLLDSEFVLQQRCIGILCYGDADAIPIYYRGVQLFMDLAPPA